MPESSQAQTAPHRERTSPQRSESLWGNPTYRQWFTADTASTIGAAMRGFAISLIAFSLTQSVVLAGWLATFSQIATHVSDVFGGTVVDRHNRKGLIIANAVFGTLLWGTVFVLIALHAIAFPIFAIVTVAASAVNGLLANATNAMLRTIIPTREYPKAQSLNQGRDSVVSIAGSPLGGVLYAAVGAMPMMGITIVGFGAAAVVECFIRLGAPDRGDAGRVTAVDDLRAAGRFLTREHPHVLHLVLICAALNFLVTGYAEVGFPYMVRTVLGFGSTAYGLAYGLVGASGLLGALVGGRVARSLSMRRFPMAIAAFSLTILPQALAMTIPAGGVMRLAVLTASTCGTMIVITLANLIAVPAIQMGCPENMTGKVMSLALSASMCAQPLGQIAYGWAYSVYPAGAVLAVTFVLATAMLPPAAHVTRRF